MVVSYFNPRAKATDQGRRDLCALRMDPAGSLRASFCIDSDAPNIQRKAAALTKRLAEPRDKALRLFHYVRDEILYNFAPDVRERRDFGASRVLELGNGFCMQKAALFAALCRASGVPARIGFQDIVDYKIAGRFFELMGTNELLHHGMNAIFLEGRWIAVDCTLDRGLSERKHYQLVEFDGVHDALLPATDRAGKPHFTIRKQSRFYNDTPWFAIRSMLSWVRGMPYEDWQRLVHRQNGSM